MDRHPMRVWQLEDAKKRLSEVVDLAIKEGPQLVTRQEEESVVILSVDDYHQLIGGARDLGFVE